MKKKISLSEATTKALEGKLNEEDSYMTSFEDIEDEILDSVENILKQYPDEIKNIGKYGDLESNPTIGFDYNGETYVVQIQLLVDMI